MSFTRESVGRGGTADDARTRGQSPPNRRRWLAAFAAVHALAALAGGAGLMAGVTDFGATINERLPFHSPALAGLALVIVVGIPLTLLAWSAWTGGARTDDVALIAGLVLIGWIVVQIVVIRAFSFFQPTYLAVGGFFVAASHRVAVIAKRRSISSAMRPKAERHR